MMRGGMRGRWCPHLKRVSSGGGGGGWAQAGSVTQQVQKVHGAAVVEPAVFGHVLEPRVQHPAVEQRWIAGKVLEVGRVHVGLDRLCGQSVAEHGHNVGRAQHEGEGAAVEHSVKRHRVALPASRDRRHILAPRWCYQRGPHARARGCTDLVDAAQQRHMPWPALGGHARVRDTPRARAFHDAAQEWRAGLRRRQERAR